ncbi:accessory gene regulator B family protein [Enterococcus crotali]|uniref:accessory gene regulator B family protein n=1 Tax=Enterococcus crotali TaxID=1453587 RepID=UPI00046F95DE|nr:accessory gene regulator B family protein [Enterococcus crotali]
MEKNIWNLWNVESYISNLILSFIIDGHEELNRIDYLKCKLGIESIVINVSKLLFIYSTAFLLNIGFETFILHLSFLTIRVFAYGDHAGSSFGCIVTSILLFVGSAGVLTGGILIPMEGLIFLQVINGLILSKYAPKATSKNPIGSDEKKKRRRMQALSSCLIMTVIMICVPELLIQNLMVIGNVLSGMSVLPLKIKKD